MTTTVEILKAARKLIEKPENWTKGEYYRPTENGYCYCAIGALAEAAGVDPDGEVPGERELANALGSENLWKVVEFNDSHTHSEVLDLFSKAIAAAEATQ